MLMVAVAACVGGACLHQQSFMYAGMLAEDYRGQVLCMEEDVDEKDYIKGEEDINNGGCQQEGVW